MSKLEDFDVVSYENIENNENNKNNETNLENKTKNQSTQVNQVSNYIYLILHDNKCYGYTNRKEKADKIIKKITNNKLNYLKQKYPELKIYNEFDPEKNMYSIYSVNSMLIVQYDNLESIVKYIQIKYIE
mgnify:CR=1 FL=1|jgi:hypothetical protein